MYLIFLDTGEKIPLESNKTFVLGRGIGPLKNIQDAKCSRQQAEVYLEGEKKKVLLTAVKFPFSCVCLTIKSAEEIQFKSKRKQRHTC
jgi:hypothetical protein